MTDITYRIYNMLPIIIKNNQLNINTVFKLYYVTIT